MHCRSASFMVFLVVEINEGGKAIAMAQEWWAPDVYTTSKVWPLHMLESQASCSFGALATCSEGLEAVSRFCSQLLEPLPATGRNDQFKHPSIPSLEFVPNTTPAALLIQMAVLDQVAEMLLQRVSADTRQFDRIANRDAPVLAGKFDDQQ
jgi:hypothetical protein